jgi:hypothetical protein
MLKITRDSDAEKQRWMVCGGLSGPWVAELRSAWAQARTGPNKKYVVDLTDVVSIDESGEDLLREMQADGAQFVTRGVCMNHILAHLKSKAKPALRRALAHLDGSN